MLPVCVEIAWPIVVVFIYIKEADSINSSPLFFQGVHCTDSSASVQLGNTLLRDSLSSTMSFSAYITLSRIDINESEMNRRIENEWVLSNLFLFFQICVMEPTETPPSNSNSLITIQPAKKLGGRGTPRRKTRRSSNSSHTALAAARTLENKLKPFRSQFQLYDQQELCDVTILYEDGRIEVQNQVHVHSTHPMTLHEIDPSETGLQSYHLDEIDADSRAYLLGQHFHSPTNPPSLPPTIASNYYQTLQPAYMPSPSSHSYLNYLAYQQNSYAHNAQENYSDTVRQVYGGINQEPDEEDDDEEQVPVPGKSKRRRRRRKSAKAPETVEEKQVIVVEPENEDSSNLPKRKRKRTRKSKRSSLTGDQLQSQSDLISEPLETTSLPASFNEQNQTPSSLPNTSPDLNEQPSSFVEPVKEQQYNASTTDGLQAIKTLSSSNELTSLADADENKETPSSKPSITSATGGEKSLRPHATERFIRRTSRPNLIPPVVIEEDLSNDMDDTKKIQPSESNQVMISFVSFYSSQLDRSSSAPSVLSQVSSRPPLSEEEEEEEGYCCASTLVFCIHPFVW